MRLSTLLTAATFFLAATLFTTTAQATSYTAESFNDNKHSVWLPDLGQRHLHFDPAGSFQDNGDHWLLSGDLVSGTDGSEWEIDVRFDYVRSGEWFRSHTSSVLHPDGDDSRIKGARWSDYRDDWKFARDVSGTVRAVTGAHAGREFSISRMPGPGDYWAQFGTCLNDKNCEQGLSTWITLTDTKTGGTYRGDINLNVAANPVPEPSAALVFGLGTVVAGTFTRRRTR